MQVDIDVTCMYTNFGGCGLSGFGDTTTLKNGQISLFDHGLYSPWSSKNLINQNRLKKFMQVGNDVTCMYTGNVYNGRGSPTWRIATVAMFILNACNGSMAGVSSRLITMSIHGNNNNNNYYYYCK